MRNLFQNRKKCKNLRNCTASEIVASIDDLLTEIFLRLPIKSLIRFKRVSKQWHALISDPGFCILRDPNPAIGMFVSCSDVYIDPWYVYVSFSSNNKSRKKQLKFIEEPTGVKIIQSCNGLLLCSSSRNEKYFVYNPTTDKFSTLRKRLDEAGGVKSRTRVLGMSLAFDPTRSRHYRVVCVRGLELDYEEYEYRFDVYSSETRSWRRRDGLFTAQVSFQNGVYWNGAIHWISSMTRHCLYFNPDDDDQILQRMTPSIPDFGYRDRNYYFGESCGHLHYIDIFESRVSVSVYELRRDYSEWFVKYRVELWPLVEAFPEMIDRNPVTGDNCYIFSIFTLVRGVKDEDTFLVLEILGKAIRYNLDHTSFETIFEFEGVDDVRGTWRMLGRNVFQYIVTLLCLV